MLVTTNIQLGPGDDTSMTADEAAQAIFQALNCKPEDSVNVYVMMPAVSGTAGSLPPPPTA